jgi:hypothetical protein
VSCFFLPQKTLLSPQITFLHTMSTSTGVETAFFRSIVSNPSKATEKCRKYIKSGDGPPAFVWVTALLLLASKLVNEEESLRKQKLQLQCGTQTDTDTIGLPLDVLACIFSYMPPMLAARMQMVNRQWQGVVTLHRVPWTIGPHGFLDSGLRVQNRRGLRVTRSVKRPSIKNTNFVSNAIAFRFGWTPPTQLLTECIELMPKLKRIQMPTCIGKKLAAPMGSGLHLYEDCVYRMATAHSKNLTHLAITHVPCVVSVRRFPYLTSLLISFGILHPIPSVVAVEALLRTLAEDITILPDLEHLGLHHYANRSDICVDILVGLLEERPKLTTLSLTGLFNTTPVGIRKLLHPESGLRSLAINVPDGDGCGFHGDGDPWHLGELLNASHVSLLVLCLPGSAALLPKGFLWAMFVAGFEPIRARHVRIEGQKAYDAHPFRRSGVGDIVWGLTGGALFAEQ